VSKRVAVVLSDEAHKIMVQNSTERTRGEWISAVILAHIAVRSVEGAGVSERVEARLIRLEDLIRALPQGRGKGDTHG
jgi:hypothetical protein